MVQPLDFPPDLVRKSFSTGSMTSPVPTCFRCQQSGMGRAFVYIVKPRMIQKVHRRWSFDRAHFGAQLDKVARQRRQFLLLQLVSTQMVSECAPPSPHRNLRHAARLHFRQNFLHVRIVGKRRGAANHLVYKHAQRPHVHFRSVLFACRKRRETSTLVLHTHTAQNFRRHKVCSAQHRFALLDALSQLGRQTKVGQFHLSLWRGVSHVVRKMRQKTNTFSPIKTFCDLSVVGC